MTGAGRGGELVAPPPVPRYNTASAPAPSMVAANWNTIAVEDLVIAQAACGRTKQDFLDAGSTVDRR